jgi:hypothetical protein
MTSAELGRQLDKLTKTSDVNRNGLVFRSYSRPEIEILGAPPFEISSIWVGDEPVAVEFTLPEESARYVTPFRTAFGGQAVNCSQGECTWHADKASPGSLKAARLSNDVLLQQTSLRCGYETAHE